MTELTMFELKQCPFCIRVRGYLDELLAQERFKDVRIRYIDEAKEPDLANSYDYYLVPTFYQDSRKLMEGRMTRDDVERVLESALK